MGDGLANEALLLIIETFDQDSLRLTLRLRMNVRMFHLTSPTLDDSAIASDVVNELEKRGQVYDLILACAMDRPEHPLWRKLKFRCPVPYDRVLVEAHRLIMLTFDRDNLKRLLSEELNVRMDAIAPRSKDNSAAALEVCEDFESRGRLCELIRAAAKERAQVPEWQLLRDAHCAV